MAKRKNTENKRKKPHSRAKKPGLKAKAPEKIFVSRPIMDSQMVAAATDALLNEKLVMGESVHKFEEEFAKYTGTDHCVTTSSGTFALEFIFKALGIISPESEVLTTPASFIATANSVIHAGAKPTFSDIGTRDFCLDPSALGQRLSPRTKAILPVHLYGMPADIDAISDAVKQSNLPIVEDACQAHGSLYKGRKCGSLGIAAAFSFYSTKNLTVGGDGGAITTNDSALAKRMEKLRDCGRITQYEHDTIGYTSRLNTVNAAIGLVQLRKLDKWNENRRKIAREYAKRLSHLGGLLTLPNQELEGRRGNYHLFAALTPKRDALKSFLSERGVFCGTNYPVPIHMQPIYRELYSGSYPEGTFPNAERLSKQVICLPMFSDMTTKQVRKVSDAISEFFEEKKGE